MSFSKKKENWGGVKASSLCNALNRYTAKGEISQEIINLGLNVLKVYLNAPYSSKEDKLLRLIQNTLENNSIYLKDGLYGTKEITEPPVFAEEEIKKFFFSRSSVRNFSDEPLTKDEIQEAIRFSTITPTACNRQSSKIYAFQDKNTICKILDAQLGDQGWCNNANTVFIITGNLSYFGGENERQEVYIDGGLFAMNFVYGLHLQHIASCYKMFVRNLKCTKAIHSICNIPENEIPIVLILAGHYVEGPTCGPMSHRFQAPCIIDGVYL